MSASFSVVVRMVSTRCTRLSMTAVLAWAGPPKWAY